MIEIISTGKKYRIKRLTENLVVFWLNKPIINKQWDFTVEVGIISRYKTRILA